MDKLKQELQEVMRKYNRQNVLLKEKTIDLHAAEAVVEEQVRSNPTRRSASMIIHPSIYLSRSRRSPRSARCRRRGASWTSLCDPATKTCIAC